MRLDRLVFNMFRAMVGPGIQSYEFVVKIPDAKRDVTFDGSPNRVRYL